MNDDPAPTLAPGRSPLLLLGLTFAAGILLENYSQLPTSGLLGINLALLFLSLAIHLFVRRRPLTSAAQITPDGPLARGPAARSSVEYVALLILYLCFLAAGALIFEIERTQVRQRPLRVLYARDPGRFDAPVELEGRLDRAPVSAPGRVHLALDVSRINFGHQAESITGRVSLILPTYTRQMREEVDQLQLRSGTGLRVWVELARGEGYRNPGSAQLDEYLERSHVDLVGRIKSPLLIELVDRTKEGGFVNEFEQARVRAESATDRLFPARAAALLKALLLGNRYFIDRDTAESFRAGGAFHILVISGTQVAFIAAGLYWVLTGLTRRRWLQAILLTASIWSFTLVVGLDQAPVVRAGVMISTFVLGRAIFRSSTAANSIGLAGLVLLAAAPQELFSASFQLTFLAVLGIALIASPLWGKLQEIGSWQPRALEPYPPMCSRHLRTIAELFFWDERRFRKEMIDAPVRFRLDKSTWAVRLGRIRLAQPLLRFPMLSIAISIAVQLSILPASVFYFHRISPGGVLLNITISLLAALTMVSGLLAVAVASLNRLWSGPLVQTTSTIASWMAASPLPVLRLPFAQLRVAEYRGGYIAIYLIFIAVLAAVIVLLDRWKPVSRRSGIEMEPKSLAPVTTLDHSANRKEAVNSHEVWSNALLRCRIPFCAASLVFSALIIVWHPGGRVYRPGWLSVHFLDVGQGDAIFIQFPTGETMLVDGGGRFQPLDVAEGETGERVSPEDRPRIGETVVARFLWWMGLTQIGVLVPTHADLDHIQGCSDVVRDFSVGRVWLAREPARDRQFDELKDALKQQGVPVVRIKQGDRFQLGGVEIAILWPREIAAEPLEWKNDDSVVMRLRYGEQSVLLTGDLDKEGEAQLLSAEQDLRASVLKVPHHGSRTSSSRPFVAAVRPEWAVISVGSRSPFGHPHAEVIETYRSLGASVIKTGEFGMITAATDGHKLELTSFATGGMLTP